MKKAILVTACYHACPFFGVSMDGMECRHPSFENNTDPYANMIITQENSRGRVPDECPLRKGNLNINTVVIWQNSK